MELKTVGVGGSSWVWEPREACRPGLRGSRFILLGLEPNKNMIGGFKLINFSNFCFCGGQLFKPGVHVRQDFARVEGGIAFLIHTKSIVCSTMICNTLFIIILRYLRRLLLAFIYCFWPNYKYFFSIKLIAHCLFLVLIFF